MNGIRRGVSAPRPEMVFVPAPIIRGGHDMPRAVAMLIAVMVKYKDQTGKSARACQRSDEERS